MTKLSLETLCIQGGYKPKNGESRIAPLYQSTTFKYDSADEVGDLFDLAKEGHMYSRISNPTVEIFEKKIAELEGGIGAVATSSGQAANLLSILTICKAGDHIIAFNNLYGGTFVLFKSRLIDLGIQVTLVDLDDTDEEIESKIGENTKLIFGEVLGNPGLRVLDIERYSKLAHKNNIPLIVDNTFPTPYLCRPIDHGADIVTHSTTKYLDGHSTCVGGIVVDSGRFNWASGRFECLIEKDENYHGLSYTEVFKEAAYITKLRVVFLRDFGATMTPFNAFLTNIGTETLALRMEKHSKNALEIAEFLNGNDYIDWVNYPLLKGDKNYDLGKKYLENGASGIISFGIKGGIEEGKKFIDSLELITLVVHVGDIRSHVLHPASMTHRQLSKEDQVKAGIEENMIRLSVGIESASDIIEDLKQAIEKSQK